MRKNAAILVLLAGCTGDITDVHLVSEIGCPSEGIQLSTGLISAQACNADLDPDIDLELNVAQGAGMAARGGSTICLMGEGFSSVTSIPTEPGDCEWQTGTSLSPYSSIRGEGYLVRDPQGSLYALRMRSLRYDVSVGTPGHLRFTYLAVEASEP